MRYAPLSGGFRHSNYVVLLASGERLVARLSDKPPQAALTEVDLMCGLPPDVPVPAVHLLDTGDIQPGYTLVLMAFVDGELLATAENHLLGPALDEIAQDLGRVLAAVHGMTFDASGFLGPGLTVAQPFPSLQAATYGYLRACLDGKWLRQRLPLALFDALESVVENERQHLDLGPAQRLVHSDCNQKNILVGECNGQYRVTALLDWEFALSASPLIDFGNLLRFENECSYDYAPRLSEAYRRHGGTLPENWRDAAAYHDLLAMCSFLTRPNAAKKVIATAQAVIEATVARFR